MNSPGPVTAGLLALSLTACLGGGSQQSDDPPVVAPPPPANLAPSIGAVPAEWRITAGDTFQVTPTAADPENDPLTFEVENQPAWASFNTANGRLSGRPADANVGSYEGIRISVRDNANVTRGNAFRIFVSARTSPPPAQALFQDGFESGTTSAWSPFSTGGITVLNYGQAYEGTYYGRATLTNAQTNDRNLYADYGTPGNPGTQIRNFFAQCAVSFDAFTGNWNSRNPQKILTYQYYDSTWAGGSFANSNRKFQVLIGVVPHDDGAHRGQYFVQIYEFNNQGNGLFRDGGDLYQSGTSYGPEDSFGYWDVLRLEVQLDTNGSATVGQLGPGFGNGIIRLWRNNELIIEYTNVNVVRGNPNVGIGRVFVTAGPSGAWAGSSTSLYWDQFEIAGGAAALTAMPSAPVQRLTAAPAPSTPSPSIELSSPAVSRNPDGVPETSLILYGRDYETQIAGDVDPGDVVAMDWASDHGYNRSGGWRAQPKPIVGGGSNGASGGWAGPVSLGYDANHLITTSFMLKMTGPLLAAIETSGGFWAHMNRALDFKYFAKDGGEGNRNGFHFGEMPPRWSIAAGGAGPTFPVGPDWRNLSDQWIWVCFVIDMRGTTAAQRYLAAYYKMQGMSGVVRMGRTYESEGLAAYNGFGIMGFPLARIFGYWDDINSRAAVESGLNQMFVQIDRLRIMPGYPDAANGPPF